MEIFSGNSSFHNAADPPGQQAEGPAHLGPEVIGLTAA
jgi:hypothetical protein